ncbi:MAG: hypothetical protein HY744_20005 [Deltaproteobacteria bacterium]|nr:hypothetical protein [Deltaproteobacteria bacterium]
MHSKYLAAASQAASVLMFVLALAAAGCAPEHDHRQPPPRPSAAASVAMAPPASGAPAAVRKPALPDANMARAAIPDAFKWQLAPVFADDAAFEQALGDAARLRAELGAFEGKLGDAKRLRGCLKLYFEARLLTNKLTLYANLRQDTDQSSAPLQAMFERSLAAMNALMGQAAFIRRHVLGLDDAAMKRAYRAEPGLGEYRPYLDELRRRRARVLGVEAERVLSLAGDNLWAEIDLNELPSDFEKIFKAMRTDLTLPPIKDEEGKKVQLTLSSYGRYRGSEQRAVRRAAVEGLLGALRGREHAFAAALAGQIRFNVFKDSGAFCIAVYGIHPFVKTNYLDEVDDLSTLSHEYGHALHYHLSMSSQPYVTANYSPFLAEVASTLNEKLLSDHLLRRARSDEERLYLLNRLVETVRTTLFRQAMFAEFELAVHSAAEAGTPVTAELLDRTYGELVRAYYGGDLTLGPNDAVEWAYIPHFFYKYYVYAYATGLAASLDLAERVASGGAEAREAYLAMLRAGSSKPPLELLRAAGVDLTRPDAIAAAARLMDRALAEIEAILAKKG